MGSYESYAGVIGGILNVADIPGFLRNASRVYSEADQEVFAWAEFCSARWEVFQDRLVATGQLFSLATQRRLLLDLWSGREDAGARIRFGRALSRMRDRVVSGYCIRRASQDSHQKVFSYRLELLSDSSVAVSAGNAGNCGEFSTPEKMDRNTIQEEPKSTLDESTPVFPNENLASQVLPAITRIPRRDPWESF